MPIDVVIQPLKVLKDRLPILIEAKSANPVMLIEDLDKLCQDEGRLSAALAFLGVIDAKQNRYFIDDFIGLPIDVSRAIFIFSVRSTDCIPEALLDRMEVVEFPGYIDKEKIYISEKYLIPAVRRNYSISEKELTFTPGSLRRLIANYTMEAGLSQLKSRVDTICRRFVRAKASSTRRLRWEITADDVEDHLGAPLYIPEQGGTHPEIGVAAGVAWTGAGGDIMMIEALRMRGAGNVVSTGSLGEIMRESVQAAHSFVRSKADLLSIPHEDFANYDIHIHFPQGAIPKDGPSAGVTISLVIASVMSNRPIRNDIAITGEATLRGKVLPVAGVKEKVAAAHRAGIYKFVLPARNKKDIREVPSDLQKEMEFIFIEHTDELFEIALLDYEPGAETLEDLLMLEMKEQAAREEKQEKKDSASKSDRKGDASGSRAAKKKRS
jgi:ATP-dependent Lon protease